MERPESKKISPRAIAFAVCVPVVGLLELGLHFRQTRDVTSEDEWHSAKGAVEKEIKPDDLLIFAPKWADPVAREHMGDELCTLRRMAWDDVSRFPRAIEVSIRGAHRSELDGWKKTNVQSFGHVEVTTFENPSYVPVIDDPLDLSRMKVWRVDSGSEHECPLERSSPQTAGTYFPPGVPIPGERFNCGGTLIPITVLSALDYSARRCVFLSPTQNVKFKVRFSQVKLGKVIHGNHGMYAEAERDKKGAPVTSDFSINGTHVGRTTHHDGDGWSYFEIPTHDLAGQTADVTAEISSSGADRHYCFEITSR